jgi:hypothetical protein
LRGKRRLVQISEFTGVSYLQLDLHVHAAHYQQHDTHGYGIRLRVEMTCRGTQSIGPYGIRRGRAWRETRMGTIGLRRLIFFTSDAVAYPETRTVREYRCAAI